MWHIIDNGHIFEISVIQYSQILDEEPAFGLHALLSGEYSADISVMRIQEVHDGIGVVFRRGCEYKKFIVFGKSMKGLDAIRSDVDPELFGSFIKKMGMWYLLQWLTRLLLRI